MSDWLTIDRDPPQEQELALWLGPDTGNEMPIGYVIGSFKNTNMGPTWVEKSVSGNINTGLRASLITHYKILEDGPNGERPNTEEIVAVGSLSSMG